MQDKRGLPEPEFSNDADDEGDGNDAEEQSAEKKINTSDIPFDEMNFSNIV